MFPLVSLLTNLIYEICSSFHSIFLVLLISYVVYPWLHRKLTSFKQTSSYRAGDEVDHLPEAPPSVDIIMLTVTMIQTIKETHSTEYEMKTMLEQLETEHGILKEKYELQRQIQREKREELEEAKEMLESKLKKVARRMNCLENIKFDRALDELKSLEQQDRKNDKYKTENIGNLVGQTHGKYRRIDKVGEEKKIIVNSANTSTENNTTQIRQTVGKEKVQLVRKDSRQTDNTLANSYGTVGNIHETVGDNHVITGIEVSNMILNSNGDHELEMNAKYHDELEVNADVPNFTTHGKTLKSKLEMIGSLD